MSASETESSFLDEQIAKARLRAKARVAALKAEHPKESTRQHAERLVTSTARKAGFGGAATGALSLFSLPVGLPAGVALTLALEAELLLGLLELYGIETAGEVGRMKLYALWAGGGLADAAKSVGLKLGADALGKVLLGTLPGQLIRRMNPVLVKLILKRLGLGWVPKVMKLWPVIGAPIGYVLDSAALKALGQASIAALESMRADGPRAPDEIQRDDGRRVG
jgi:hypothetical protein